MPQIKNTRTSTLAKQKKSESLKKKNNLSEDILIKKDQKFPESTEIQEILDRVGDNKALEKDAINMHSWRTFLGIKAHSILVFIARLIMDTVTKKLGEK